ncbi:uncharacterized protein T069G_11349 [Trichoderma breve]|uniref:ABM domain-containing protein n=1 Tax=Trichoderma breve TaxID=2034170 RepID=A0A9W9B5Z9_9HYPO|nr:uncharacterized protein T069G_11349 [Trichoderma breve]KAJ4854370.1 hypothetical protein T069G_11349 [Trichoderma breve]
MGQKLLFASYLPKDKEARDMLLRHLNAIANNALAKEPGVLKRIITTSKEESTDPAVYVFEEYADEAALQTHNQEDAVKEMINWLRPGVLNSAPTIHRLEPLEGCNNFTRPEVANHADSFIVFSEVEYKPDTASKTHAYWEDIVNTSRAERPGTLIYGVWKDINQPNKLFIFHAYESMDYLMKVHVPSKPVQAMLENEKDLRIGLRPWMLQMRGGYLYKDLK